VVLMWPGFDVAHSVVTHLFLRTFTQNQASTYILNSGFWDGTILKETLQPRQPRNFRMRLASPACPWAAGARGRHYQ